LAGANASNGQRAESGEPPKAQAGRQKVQALAPGKEPKTKRPSVETEGRLTIACHMKNLQKIDVGYI
jgi:hypothetical protein